MSKLDENILKMQFDPRTIEHLGIQMYSTLPPVIAELVSNSYDAEAENVSIILSDSDPNNKTIEVNDDGIGMTFAEINQKFLIIGRNRRIDERSEKSKNGKRFVIGKKGLGKLAFFGIANHIRIETVQDYRRTTFELDWDVLRNIKLEQFYQPALIEKNVVSEIEKGTRILLSGITRKSNFNQKQLAYSLSKSFNVLDEPDFSVQIFHNEEEPIKVENSLKFESLDILCRWKIPDDLPSDLNEAYLEHAGQVTGFLFSTQDTVAADMRGIALFSRGKLVNNYSFLDVRATSHGYSYITGILDVSFIEDLGREVIATNRQSLNWELEETGDLKIFLEFLYREFFNFQKEQREILKEEEVKKDSGIDLDEWYETLPKHERKLAKRIVGSIISAQGIEIKKAVELIKFTQDSFQFESFKELASELEDTGLNDQQKLLSFFREWKLVEAKEMYKIAIIRIETIQKFKNHINNNSREVPEVHSFLRQFPWLLDPRIMNFKDEVTYSSLLKDEYPETEEVIEEDRRIDFLCQRFANTFFIIELKRPKKKIGMKELEQAMSYSSFISRKISREHNSVVTCYIIGDSLVNTDVVQGMADSLQASGHVIFKPYEELLSSAIKYHQEFIDQYNIIAK